MLRSVVRALLVASVVVAIDTRPALSQKGAPPPVPVLPGSPQAASAESLTISLITIGQGSDVYELFGHNALWLHDPTFGDVVFNWGVFDMRAKGFLLHFLRGRMDYTMQGTTLDSMLEEYRAAHRTMWVQELDLTPAERATIRDFILWNNQPENAGYKYDYFLDNCSTRVRDILNRALGGAIEAQLKAKPTNTTFRSQGLRMMQRGFTGFLYDVGIDIGLGRTTDPPISQWEESFLPGRLQEDLRAVRLDGGTRALVKSERVLQQTDQPPEITTQPALGRTLFIIGLVLGLPIMLLGNRPERGLRRLAGSLIIVWSVLAGVLGLAITFLWVATDHHFAHSNENVLLFHPFWLAGIPIGLGVIRGRARPWHWLAINLFAACAVVLTPLGHLIGVLRQDNAALLCLVIPVTLAIWIRVFLQRVQFPRSRH